jgi:hypothetical protein
VPHITFALHVDALLGNERALPFQAPEPEQYRILAAHRVDRRQELWGHTINPPPTEEAVASYPIMFRQDTPRWSGRLPEPAASIPLLPAP